ncbi:hypothetical protein MAV3388_09195 [Mycobacterium avium subsp. hominissuis 3388]|nr:hypothetical protein MAV3388_09195 [Mycobacterium avium subsp. hominissuis 3388]
MLISSERFDDALRDIEGVTERLEFLWRELRSRRVVQLDEFGFC